MGWEVTVVVVVVAILLIVALIAARNPKHKKLRFGVFVEREKFEDDAPEVPREGEEE